MIGLHDDRCALMRQRGACVERSPQTPRRPNTADIKESPGRAGASPKEKTSRGTLDAPILSEGTNQARRGSHKRPDPPRLGKAGRDLPRRTRGRGRVMTKREATLNERTRMYSRQTQRSAVPLRSPSFGAVQCLELLRGKQAHWRARPPILRTQSRSKRGQRQKGWSCASEFSRSIGSAASCGSSSRPTGSGMPDPGFE
jgi:hypothetical protein